MVHAREWNFIKKGPHHFFKHHKVKKVDRFVHLLHMTPGEITPLLFSENLPC